MLGIIDYIQHESKPHWGIIVGYDGHSYWFKNDYEHSYKKGDIVRFSGGKDGKGYYATTVEINV